MELVYLKMLAVGLVVGLIINLMIPTSEDGKVSRQGIAFFAVVGSVAGHFLARRAVGITYGAWGLAASATGAVVIALIYLLLSPRED